MEAINTKPASVIMTVAFYSVRLAHEHRPGIAQAASRKLEVFDTSRLTVVFHRTSMGKKRGDRQEFLPGTLDMLILKTLSRQVMHGYGIAEHIRQVSVDVLKVEEGSLYPALQRLQLQGLIASEWGHSANNRRARYYRLTAAGRRALGESESSFSRLIEAIARVMKPA